MTPREEENLYLLPFDGEDKDEWKIVRHGLSRHLCAWEEMHGGMYSSHSGRLYVNWADDGAIVWETNSVLRDMDNKGFTKWIVCYEETWVV